MLNHELSNKFLLFDMLVIFIHVIGPTGYGLVWNFPKKFAAKSSAERAWQMTINKDSTLIRNQKLSSNDRDRNVYLAFLLMRQRQDTILVMLKSVTHVLEYVREKKKEQDRTHSFSWNPLTESNQHEEFCQRSQN